MVLWFRRSCKELCGAVVRAGEQNNPTVQSYNSMPWWPSSQRRRIGICWRTVKSVLSNCPEMPVFGTHCWTRHSMVSKQTCTNSHKLDQSLWQTLGSFDFWYTRHEWILSNIVMWETLHSNAAWDCSKTLTSLERRLKNRSQWDFVHIWKSYVCSHKLDVQEKSFCFTQFNGIWSYFSWCRSANGWNSRSWSLGILGIQVLHSSSNQNAKTKENVQGNLPHDTPSRKAQRSWIMQRWLCFLKREVFSLWCHLFLKIMQQWSRWSSKAEVQPWDTYPEPTELRLIGYLTESTWTPKSKSNMLIPKTNSQTYSQMAMLHVTSGTIFSICSISAFSAQQPALDRCRKECNKEQEKRELWQNRSRRWTWSRVLRQALPQRRARVHPVAWRYSKHPVWKVRISWHNVPGNHPPGVQVKMTQRQVLKCG